MLFQSLLYYCLGILGGGIVHGSIDVNLAHVIVAASRPAYGLTGAALGGAIISQNGILL